MNDPALFVAGAGVTVLVVLALGLLVWGAILDGREQTRQRELAGAASVRPLKPKPAVTSTDRVPLDAA
jgi:hypothetical protein